MSSSPKPANRPKLANDPGELAGNVNGTAPDPSNWEAGVDALKKPTRNIIRGVTRDWSDDASHDEYYYSKAVQDALFHEEFRRAGLLLKPWRPSSHGVAQQYKKERASAWADPRTNPDRIGKEKRANIFAATELAPPYERNDDYLEYNPGDWWRYDQERDALQAMVAMSTGPSTGPKPRKRPSSYISTASKAKNPFVLDLDFANLSLS